MKPRRWFAPLLLVLPALALGACTRLPRPNQVIAPDPIRANSGRYLSPYTSDSTIAQWVVKGRSAKLGAAVGRYAGAKTGEAALSAVPIVGNWLGGKAGDKAGREIALRLVGGQETMRETSDLSFDRMEDMIVYLYARHYDPKNKEWRETFDLTKEIYPDIEKKWVKALKKAPRRRS